MAWYTISEFCQRIRLNLYLPHLAPEPWQAFYELKAGLPLHHNVFSQSMASDPAFMPDFLEPDLWTETPCVQIDIIGRMLNRTETNHSPIEDLKVDESSSTAGLHH